MIPIIVFFAVIGFLIYYISSTAIEKARQDGELNIKCENQEQEIK